MGGTNNIGVPRTVISGGDASPASPPVVYAYGVMIVMALDERFLRCCSALAGACRDRLASLAMNGAKMSAQSLSKEHGRTSSGDALHGIEVSRFQTSPIAIG